MARAVLVLLLLVAACKRRPREAVAAEPDPSVEAAANPAVARERPALGSDRVAGGASVRVRATMNGRPIAEGVRCEVTVFDEGSSVSRRNGGLCGDLIGFDPGSVDVVVRLFTDGGYEVERRMSAERFGADTRTLNVDVPFAVGRLRVTHVDAPNIRSCDVALRGTNLRGPDATTFTVPVGAYTVDFECQDAPAGTTRVSVANLEVKEGQDTTAMFKIEPGANPVPMSGPVPVPPPAAAPAPTGDTAAAPGGLPVIPGLPMQAPTNPEPVTTSARPEDLTVQSTKENP